MAYSKGFFSAPPSASVGQSNDEKSTTEDAVCLAVTLEKLEERVSQMLRVKEQTNNSTEADDCKIAMKVLEQCYEEVRVNAQADNSPSLR